MSGELQMAGDSLSTDRTGAAASQLLDAVSEAVVATDLRGAVIYWNAAAEHLSGVPLMSALGRPLSASMVPVESDVDVSQILTAVAAGARWSAETRLRRADGRIVTVLITCTPIREQDAVRGMIAVYADVTQHDDEERRESADHSRLVGELRIAIAEEQFRLRYQPVVSLESGRCVALEALIRWEHPTRGTIPPAEFIDVAERTGLILEIGTWVLNEASRQSAQLVAQGLHLDIAVNLSARQLISRNLIDEVSSALIESGADPQSLILEVTESAVMHDAQTALEVLTALRGLGVRLAIDDFGTGYSSLVYLKKFPVDMLKIDGAFVNGLGRNADDFAIVTSIIGLARAVGVQAVAEGVETQEQLLALRALGCDLAQGYLWSGAVAPGELRALLRRIDELATVPGLLVSLPPVPPQAVSSSAESISLTPEPKMRRHGVEDDCLTRVSALRSLGASPHSIASALNLEGWRTSDGRRWHASTVRALLNELERTGD